MIQTMVLLKRLTGPPIGISVSKMFVVDRSSVISVSKNLHSFRNRAIFVIQINWLTGQI